MNTKNWLLKHTDHLNGKTVAITGATGGIGLELCIHLAELGAGLILLNRSKEKTRALIDKLHAQFPHISVDFIPLDLEDMTSVKSAVERLDETPLDVIIHNAGAYSIARRRCDTGFDNVFMINFLSPYYITKKLMPSLRRRGGRVVIVGSIAHNYSKTDPNDPDFTTRTASSLVYGNAKRHLMLSMYKLFEGENDVGLAITHPGITFTNITAHYPKLIFAVIKHPMKVIFMKPKVAALSILMGVFENTAYREWIGPRLFNIWGLPKKQVLHTFTGDETASVFAEAEKMYDKL